MALGLTRDPYLVTGVDNMWVNAGTTQFHLPTGPAQVLRGVTVLALPDLAALASRLRHAAPPLAGTRFTFTEQTDGIHVTCPWGNRLRCVTDDGTRLGIVAVELATAPGTTDGIARFYREVLGACAQAEGGRATIVAGLATNLVFIETEADLAPFDGAHVQIALADFSGPYRRLLERGLVSEENGPHQYRFQRIIDPETGATLCEIEHEVRSMRHPMYARPLVNRDPAITVASYAPGREAFVLGHAP